MKNITEQQKAEARAYNDTIKNSMSIENKLEILYTDLIDYVADELGAEKMEALENIINTFDSKHKENPQVWTIEDEIVCIMYGYNRVKDGHESVIYFNTNTKKADTEEFKQINKYYSYFYQGLEKYLNKIIDNYGESLEPKVNELKAKKEAKAVEKSLF